MKKFFRLFFVQVLGTITVSSWILLFATIWEQSLTHVWIYTKGLLGISAVYAIYTTAVELTIPDYYRDFTIQSQKKCALLYNPLGVFIALGTGCVFVGLGGIRNAKIFFKNLVDPSTARHS